MAEVIHTIESSGGDYTSLSAWESGEQHFMVNANEDYVAEVYGGFDAGDVNVAGWGGTSSSRRIIIRAASGEGHNGVWDDAKAKSTGGFQTIDIDENYVVIYQMQIQTTSDDNNIHGINVQNNRTAFIINCIIRGQTAMTYGSLQTGIDFGVDRSTPAYVLNTIIYDFNEEDQTDNAGIRLINGSSSGRVHVFNCTIYNCYTGIVDGYNDVRALNTICSNCNTDFGSGFNSSSDYNISSDTSAPGGNSTTSHTVSFNDSANDDFLVTTSDTAAPDGGTDLSGTPAFLTGGWYWAGVSADFDYDIQNTSRTGTWDIGANVPISGGGGGPSYIQAQVIMVT